MFLDHFRLSSHPFVENLPVRHILRDPRIDEALARLTFFLDEGNLALIVGQTGIGKSTLLKLFLHDLPQNRYRPVYLHLTPMNGNAFLRMIVTHLGEAPKMGKDRLFLQIVDRVKQNEKCTLLLIDEAHMLEPKILTDLRLLLSSIEDHPLKIILSGQESLRHTLKRSSHADLVHRITVRYCFPPLTKAQTEAYIDSRTTSAGGNDKIFEAEAKALIHDYTGGIPRQINNVATACLINAAAQNRQKITEQLVNQTMDDFRLP